MTEEEVVNVRGEEISENGDDHRKIKAEHCNGVAKEKEEENGNVGGEVDGGIKAVADSGASDPIVTVDGNGVASEDGKVDGDESIVTVTEGEGECEVVNNNKENDCADACEVSNGSVEGTCETATVDVVEREGESGSADGQNGAGSAAVSGDEKDVTDTVAEGGDDLKSVQNDVSDREQIQCAVENEIGNDVTDSSVEDGVKVGASDVQNGVAAVDENCGDVDVNKEVADVNKEVADVNKSDREFEGEAVQNSTVDRAEEMEIPVVAEGVTAATADVVETVDSGVQGASESVSDKDHKSEESENVVSADVSDEKHIGTNGIHHEAEFESVVGAAEVSECAEKNEIPVDVDGVCAATTDVKECAGEDAQNGLEKVPVESVSDADVDRSLVGAGVQNGLAEVEESECAQENKIPVDGGELERSGEGSGHEVVPEGENLSALNSADMIGDGDAVSEVNGNAVKSEGEPSVEKCEMKNNGVENEAEPSNNAVKGESSGVPETRNDAVRSEAEPSNNAVESEVELSNDAVKGEPVEVPEMRNNAVESEAEPSNKAVESDAERSNNAVKGESVDVPETRNDTVESEAEPSNNAVESEAEQSNNAVKGESADVPETRNDAVESEAEPSNNAVESEAERSNNAVKGESIDVPEMRNDAVESEAEPSNNAVESEAERSINAVKGDSVDKPEMRNDAVESEAERSNNAVKGESVDVPETRNDAVESEAEPSNNAVESEADPSVDVPVLKTNAVESEAEPLVEGELNNAVESETERSNNAVQSEADPSVDIPDLKTEAVESDAEPSVEGELSVEGEGSNHADEDSRPAQERSAADALDGQTTEVVKRPFYYLIRIPRYDDDENIKEQIQNAFRQVEEKTKIRDAIRSESQTKKASCKEYGQEVRAAISAERAARDLLKSKRQEMDSVQSTMNRLNNAISVGDIDGKIRNMEHMIQHETLPLKEEKQLIRQIKQLKQNRDELSTTMAKQDQSHQSLDDKDSIEEHFKLLKKELESLRANVQKTEAATKAARKKYEEECNQLSELLARFKAADDVRQEAYAKLQALKKQLHEKGKYFWEYKNAAKKGQELAAEGKKEELQGFCIDQVERIMELWNNNDEFRRDYVRCNTRSTLRRLQTLDGRSLGPDEEPPVIPNAFTERASKIDSLVSQSTLEQEKKSISTEPVNIKDESVSKVVVQKTERSQATKAKKPAKPAPLEKSVVAVSRWGDESDEDTREEPVRTKEEEERILKAEKARKEEEAAKLKEMKRLEEIEKAKEALQRKKRNAEKAQQRAVFKAQKEAEQKEKEREKKARKKERRKAASPDTAAADNAEQEAAPSSETPTRTMEECDQSEKPIEVTKRSQKPSQFTRQTKVKSLPLSLRNRGKRRIQPWMWVLIAVVVVVALFYMGNNSFLRSSLQGFGF